MSSPSVYLIDGNSMIYRAYYAIRSLTNSKGEATNALYGFILMLRKLLNEDAPEYMAVCFDPPGPTFRHKKYEAYKAHRKPMPDDLVEQLQPIREYCRRMCLSVFEKQGYEADDMLGTLAVKCEKLGLKVYIVTGDKDAMQLVTPNIAILNPHKEGLVMGPEEVRKKLDGLGPDKVIEMMALMGDASDNIPGARGIGEKTAMKLIREFGSVDALYQNLSKIRSKSQQNLLRESEANVRLSRELVTIDCSIPVEISLEALKIKTPDVPALAEFFTRYELVSFLKELTPASAEPLKERKYRTVTTGKEWAEFLENLGKQKEFSFDTETTSSDPIRADLVGMSFSWADHTAVYVPVSSDKHQGSGLPAAEILNGLKPVLENPKIQKIGQNLKYDWIVMVRHGIRMSGVAFDTMIASYLIHPLKRNHNLDDLSLEHLGIRKITTESLIGSGKNQKTMDQVPLDKIAEYACEDADCVWQLRPVLEKKLKEADLVELFRKVEMPLSEVLAKIELNGVKIDTAFLKKMSDDACVEIERLTASIYESAGREFNINSPKQLSEILFEELKLPKVKKTKTGVSTDVKVLEKLAEKHELPKMLLEYREKVKLKSTYLDALPEMIEPGTERVHTSYNQTLTVTGRLSSSEPNLQNIPVKTEEGRLIRKAFRPRAKGRKILSADYSQIELRILAHLSGDPYLVEAFKADQDVHKATATVLYGISEKQVDRVMRNVAKTINFSVIYGKTAYGLSQDLGISVSEADDFITGYFKRYKTVREYLDGQKELARRQGYLTTILGRRSYFPEINAKNAMVRQFAERSAINAPIQGSAADIIKLAMIRLQNRLEEKPFESLMTMQVHDELVLDVAEGEAGELLAVVKKEMEGAFPLRVPLRVDTFLGDSWYKD